MTVVDHTDVPRIVELALPQVRQNRYADVRVRFGSDDRVYRLRLIYTEALMTEDINMLRKWLGTEAERMVAEKGRELFGG